MANNIYKTTGILAIILIVAKIVGILKQSVFAAYFGASKDMDMFLITTGFFDDFTTTFFTSISITFITIYLRIKNDCDKKRLNTFVNSVLFLGILFTGVVIILFNVYSKYFVGILAWNYNEEDLCTLSSYFSFIVFILGSAFISRVLISILEAEENFYPTKFSGFILSFTSIVACVFFSDCYGIMALFYGFVAYYLIENIFLYNFTHQYFKISYFFIAYNEELKQLLKLSIPLIIGNACVMVNNIVGKSVATGISEGIVSSLAYGQLIFSSTYSILVGSLCAVLLPSFTNMIVNNEIDRLKCEINRAVNRTIVFLVPVVLLIYISAEDITKILFYRGNFDIIAVNNTVYAIKGYILGIIFISVRDILVRVHYAFNNTIIPVINSIIGIVFNIVLIFFLTEKYGVFGITIAAAFSYIITSILLIYTIRFHLSYRIEKVQVIDFVKVMLSICFILLVINNVTISFSSNILNLFFKFTVVYTIYCALLILFKVKEADYLLDKFIAKFRR